MIKSGFSDCRSMQGLTVAARFFVIYAFFVSGTYDQF